MMFIFRLDSRPKYYKHNPYRNYGGERRKIKGKSGINENPKKLLVEQSRGVNHRSEHLEIGSKHGGNIDVETMHVSCHSDSFTEGHDYIGLVLYEFYGETDWTLNGRRIRSGYIYLVRSDKLQKYSSLGIKSMHGRAYWDLFKQRIPGGGNLVESRFSVHHGEWKHWAKFNAVRTPYTCNNNFDEVTEFDLVKDAIMNWNNGHGQNYRIGSKRYLSGCTSNLD